MNRDLAATRLAAFARRGHPTEGFTPAAVALAVVDGSGSSPSLLLTLRSGGLRTHSGQFALPGGRLDAGEDAAGAARRELLEELGLVTEPGAEIGQLDDLPTRSGFLITPVVLWLDDPPPPRPNPAEVAEVHTIDLGELARSVPRFLPTATPGRPLIQYPLVGTEVYAPTAAIVYQFRQVVLHAQHTRVAHLEQPRFAWS